MSKHNYLPLAAAFLFSCLVSYAQSTTFGSLVGTVQDKSGAIIPGAQIAATNLDTGALRTVLSSDAGQYEVLDLPAGRYSLAVTKPGFGVVRVPEIGLDARQERRTNVSMDVAATSETVQVEASAVAINTENGTVEQMLNGQTVQDLPANYRGSTTSPLAAIVALPNVQQDKNGAISVAGGLPFSTRFTVDGTNNNTGRTVNGAPLGANYNNYPSTELVAEFKVSALGNDAQYASASDITITTKSGTNALHGSLFEYMQNAALDAQIYGSPTKQGKSWNTFGGSLSGPVILPKLYNGHNKTFFFADYEGNQKPGTTLVIASLPTQAMRSGNLNGLPGPAVVNPGTNAPFPNNQIPASLLNSVATNFLTYYPLPNISGPAANNYRVQLPTPISTNGYDAKIDQSFGSKDQISGRWDWKNINFVQSNGVLPTEQDYESDRNLTVGYTHIFTPGLINEFRFGFNRVHYDLNHFPYSDYNVVPSVGLTGLNVANTQGLSSFPYIDFSTGTGFAVAMRNANDNSTNRNAEFIDSVSWVKGKHYLKFGADVSPIRTKYQNGYQADGSGRYTFTNNYSGNSYANFLLGVPSTTIIFQTSVVDLTGTNKAFYVQDSYRVTNSLTINYGIRWEIQPSPAAGDASTTTFLPNGTLVLPPQAVKAGPDELPTAFLYALNLCPGVVPGWTGVPAGTTTNSCTPVSTAFGNSAFATSYANYEPRLSLAWRPFGNTTVFRGSIGKYALLPSEGQLQSFSGQTVPSLTYTNTITAGVPLYQWPAAIPGTGLNPGLIGARTMMTGTPYLKAGQMIQWNITLEHEFKHDWLARLSYLGSNAYGMVIAVDLNQIPPSTVPFSHAEVPFPNLGFVSWKTNQGNSNYQAFNPSLERRLSGGLSLQANYTWAKSLGDVSGDAPIAFVGDSGGSINNRFCLACDRGNDPGTRRHRVLVTALYELPVGTGKRFLGGPNRVVNGILGGWRLSTISMWETGPYLTPTISANLAQDNTNDVTRGTTVRPDQIPGVNGNVSNPTPADWWNINAFVATPAGAGRIGNAGVGVLEGPGTVAISAGLGKTFALREKARLRFEASFTNLPNHPNFAAPPTAISTPSTFGKVTTTQTTENSGNRVGQLALRIDF